MEGVSWVAGPFYTGNEGWPWSERTIGTVPPPCLFLATRPHATDKASWLPGNAGKEAKGVLSIFQVE